jgi:hypothetical protein
MVRTTTGQRRRREFRVVPYAEITCPPTSANVGVTFDVRRDGTGPALSTLQYLRSRSSTKNGTGKRLGTRIPKFSGVDSGVECGYRDSRYVCVGRRVKVIGRDTYFKAIRPPNFVRYFRKEEFQTLTSEALII